MAEQEIRPASKALKVTWNLIHFLATTFVVFCLAYIMGRTILTGGLKGGDSAMHVGYTVWLNKYFPSIPHWYPLQGGGESLLHGYPLLSHLLIVLLHRTSNLSIVQAFRLLSFLSIPLTAMGIYFYCWAAFRKKTMGLIASFLYILAPLAWTWMYDWGFFSFSLGMVFLPATLVCFDRYMFVVLQRPSSSSRRLWLAGVCLCLSLASLTHLSVGAGAVVYIILYIVFSALVNKSWPKSLILKKGMIAIIFIGFVVGLLLAFYLIPFYRYGQVANREGLNLLALHQIPQIPKLEFFGLKPINPRIIHTRMSFPLIITVFFGIGILLSARYSRKTFALILAAIFAVIYALFPVFSYNLRAISSSLAMVFGIRSTLVVAMLLFPVGAAYGAFAVANTVTSRIHQVRRKTSTKENNHSSWFSLRDAGTSCLALIIVMVSSLWLGGITAVRPYHVSYGPSNYGLDLRDIWEKEADDPCTMDFQDPLTISLCNLSEARARLNIQEFLASCNRLRDQNLPTPELCNDQTPTGEEVETFLAQCEEAMKAGETILPCNARVEGLISQLLLKFWPSLVLEDADLMTGIGNEIASVLPNEPMLRIDISPYLGRVAQYFTSYTSTSQIQAYTHQLSLIHLMWGYQLGIFYSDEYGSPKALNDLADWFGIKYVILHPEKDPINKYNAAGWERVSGGEGSEIWYYPEASPLASARVWPTILVIGTPENGAYSQIFRLANEGLAPYNEFLIVEGNDRIDQYSLEELQRFDLLFLHGYKYKNGEKAWSLLNEYVSQGGSLYIDTGWQYEVPEWEFEQAPQVLPITKLFWTNYGQESKYVLENIEIAGDIDPEEFGPMVWEDDPWSVSGANREDLHDWGRIILSNQGHPLIVAGEYGQGRVVWSGMNFVAHLIAYDNQEEVRLLHNLLDWLSEGIDRVELAPPLVVREHPDSVDFSLDAVSGSTTWLYWREAYYPNWHAYLSESTGEKEIPIYRAGPGFILMPIDTIGESVSIRLEWQLALIEMVAIAASLLGIILLIAIVIDGLFLGGNGLTWIKITFTMRLPKPFLDERTHEEAKEQKLVNNMTSRVDVEEQEITKGESQSTYEESLLEKQLTDEQEELRQAWLENTSHTDDHWAERLLKRNQSNDK